jgi:hypothetical protein
MNAQTNNTNDRAQELESENAELRNRLAEHGRIEQERGADELLITKKMACGLTREQAVGVIERQRHFDANKAAK